MLRRLAKDSVIYGGADFATKLLAFVAFPVVAEALSPDAFGALELIATSSSLLGMIVGCGLSNSVQRFYWDPTVTRDTQPAVVTSGLIAMLALGAVAMVLALLAMPVIEPWVTARIWPVARIGLVAAVVGMAFTQWSQYVLDTLRLQLAPWRFLVLASLSRVLTIVGAVAAVVWWRAGVAGYLVAQAAVLVLVLPLGLWMIRSDLRIAPLDRTWIRTLVGYGYPFIYAGIAFWLFGSMDRWMLMAFSTVEEVGIYSVAFRYASIVMFVSTAFGQAWSPYAMKVRRDHPERYRAVYGQVLVLLLWTMLVVGGTVSLFAGELIATLMSERYVTAALPLAILCFGVVVQSTQQVTAVGISIAGRTAIFARAAWLSAAVNFAANAVLIPRLGAAGAAYGTILAYVVLTSTYLFWTQRLHPISLPVRPLLATLAVLVGVAAFSFLHVNAAMSAPVIARKAAILALVLVAGWVIVPRDIFREAQPA